MKLAVTDLDYIVSLGHTESAARDALQITHGNKTAALYLLNKPDTPSNTKAKNQWRKEANDEWITGNIATPDIAENRAVHKSPIYVFVEHYHTAPKGDEYIFEMEVTLKDGRQWKLGRTYPEFYSLWASLPFGTCVSFTNSFPPSAALQFVFGELSKAFLEKRLRSLSEWIRELVLNEACMSSPKILDLLYKFVDVEKNGAKESATGANVASPVRPVSMTKVKSPLLSMTQDSTEAAAVLRKKLHFDQAPLLGLEHFPVTPGQAMPFKVNVKKLQCYHDIIAIKLSTQTKEAEDEVRNLTQKTEDAVMVAAMAESATTDRFTEKKQQEQEQREHYEHDTVTKACSSIDTNHEVSAPTGPTIAEPPLALPVSDGKSVEGNILTPSAPADPRPPSPPVARLVDTTEATLSHDVSLLKKFQNTSMLDLKIDTEQLRKDCRRDRLIVQGKRLNGSDVSLEQIYALCQESILQEMGTMGKKFDLGLRAGTKASPNSKNPFDDPAEEPTAAVGQEKSVSLDSYSTLHVLPNLQQDCERFSRFALSVLSRTESGYLSHASLSEIFDTENFHQRPDFAPCFFVPESTLSDPLQLTFRVIEKGGAPQALRGKFAQPALAEKWCVECTGETSTVYRLMDAMSLEPLLQIRVIFQVTLFGMPQYSAGTSRASPDAIVTGLTIKEGKCYLLVDKATTTTSRDWKSAV